MHFIFIKKKWLLICFLLVVIGLSGWYYLTPNSVQTAVEQQHVKTIDIDMITAEFSTKLDDGTEIEAYRWDPGTIVIEKNQKVNLKIHGINGKEHSFHIEGTNITGVVAKGKTTEVPLFFKKEGTYRLICDTHSHDGAPMIGYIVVD
ncbi:cupredoxin domain-containing protein [Gottfriedia acidiceleris]|uniref:cupredoxin domain-containing protein n=1 Tax=Gottfriedia acidiceleris TaxID=371036 RepID=UPI00101E0CB2|nr:cupredoxin domain-containing protein [Gottfriedia acidiceleris]